CRSTSGKLSIESELGIGTKVMATLGLTHIDRQPLGDIAGVVVILIIANPQLRFIYSHSKDDNLFSLDTNEVKEILDGVPIETPEVGKMIKEMISSNLEEL
ncbi:MAG: ATP-binding protein, partial [Bacteroidales bacterium]|nr:ATP-binding protein [Bacteroidales bacterium]